MKIKQIIRRKINDDVLYNNLKNFASGYKISRQKALEGLDFDELRKEI